MSPFAELDVVSSRVLTDYIAHFPSILTSSTAGNKEVFHWEILDMRLQLLESAPALVGKRLNPRKRVTSVEDPDGDSHVHTILYE
jgi:hypothetical protein